MSEQAQEKAQSESSQHMAEITAVVAVLAAGPPLVTAIQAISAAAKLPKKLILAVLALTKYKPGKKVFSGQGVMASASLRNLRYRAAYLINAARRLGQAPDLQTALAREKKLFADHQAASKRRLAAAKATLSMAAQTGETVLGWAGILDDATTPDCRWLIGKNFNATNPPDGLHPGGRHPKCRCFPAPAWPGKPVVTTLPSSLGSNSPL